MKCNVGYFYNLSVIINLCCSQIVTMTSSETSVTAWVLAGLLCAVGLWCCAPLPLCRSMTQLFKYFYLNVEIFSATECKT